MTDFMRWLYANYIKPQLDEADSTPYEMSLSLLDSCLEEDLKTQDAIYYSVLLGLENLCLC